jgi:hypothetical protein
MNSRNQYKCIEKMGDGDLKLKMKFDFELSKF